MLRLLLSIRIKVKGVIFNDIYPKQEKVVIDGAADSSESSYSSTPEW